MLRRAVCMEGETGAREVYKAYNSSLQMIRRRRQYDSCAVNQYRLLFDVLFVQEAKL